MADGGQLRSRLEGHEEGRSAVRGVRRVLRGS